MRKGFVAILLVGLVVAIVLVAVGAYYFDKKSIGSMTTKPVVQVKVSPNPSPTPNETANYPITKPDYSQNRTIQEVGGAISINFDKCTSDIRRIDAAFGSTTIEVRGKEGNYCLMYLGGEVENPNYDGRLATKCKVPISLGVKEFNKGGSGVDTASIQQYCSQT